MDQRNADRKGRTLSQFAVYFDSSPVHQNGASRDGKTKTRTADLSRMGFVYPVKAFKNMFLGFLGNTDAGILHFDIEILVIHI